MNLCRSGCYRQRPRSCKNRSVPQSDVGAQLCRQSPAVVILECFRFSCKHCTVPYGRTLLRFLQNFCQAQLHPMTRFVDDASSEACLAVGVVVFCRENSPLLPTISESTVEILCCMGEAIPHQLPLILPPAAGFAGHPACKGLPHVGPRCQGCFRYTYSLPFLCAFPVKLPPAAGLVGLARKRSSHAKCSRPPSPLPALSY